MSRPELVVLGALRHTAGAGVAWLVGRYAVGSERLDEDHGRSGRPALLEILHLPSPTGRLVTLARSIDDEPDQERLERHGWRLRPGLAVSVDTDTYRRPIVRARPALTAAHEPNVRLQPERFSERSAPCPTAGRPFGLQGTGSACALPVVEGLLAFDGIADAVAAVDDVAGHLDPRRGAAVEPARAGLDKDVVPGRPLHLAVPPSPARPVGVRPGWAAPVDLPADLVLTPASRRPLRLPHETVERVLRRSLPVAPPKPGDPSVSVVVVTHDNLALTRMALESVLAHGAAVPYELVVVDNASTDGTPRYLSALAARNPHVRVRRNDRNLGFAAANNQALALARGEHLVLLNNDTITTPGWLDGLLDHLADEEVGLVGPVTNRCGNEAEVPADHAAYADVVEEARRRRGRPAARRDLPVAVMFCVAMRRDVLRTVGLLDERFEVGMFEDDDYSRRVRDAGYRVTCADDVFVHHFGEGTLGALVPTGRHAELFEANRRRFQAKWGTVWEPHARRPARTYRELRHRLPDALAECIPTGTVALVVSRGDDALLDIPGLQAWHFPRLDDGTWAGHHPGDDGEAIERLEELRRQGAGWLVVPSPSLWWLEHYKGFRAHLDERHRRAAASDVAVVYELNGAPPPDGQLHDEREMAR